MVSQKIENAKVLFESAQKYEIFIATKRDWIPNNLELKYNIGTIEGRKQDELTLSDS